MHVLNTEVAANIRCWCLLVVRVYVACAQNSFYHFRTVVTHVTFDLVTVAAFVLPSNILIIDLIRGETVIVVKGDKSLSRLRTFHHHVTIIHASIIKFIGRSVYALYKTFKCGLCQTVS